jgi:periodic tryptophan protein 1
VAAAKEKLGEGTPVPSDDVDTAASMEEDGEGKDEDEGSDDEDDQELNVDGFMGGLDVVDNEEAFDLMEYGEHALATNAFEEDDEEEDQEDDQIKATDACVCVAMSDEEYSHLEVQLYAEDGTLFVHHDIILPDMPLCLAWLDCPPFKDAQGGQSECGNYMAVGTMSPAIEIWNLDVMDPLEPTATLGGLSMDKKPTKDKKGKGKGKKGGKAPKDNGMKPGSHVDAVMALSWNKSYRQALASGSADESVKVWDVTNQACLHTFSHHSDKVQCVAWHPNNAWLLATGSFDNTVGLLDCRTDGSNAKMIPIGADIEDMLWDPFNNNLIFCSMENGLVSCIDIRQPGSALYSWQAHDKCASSLSFSPLVPSMLVTGSQDETVKVWDTASAPEPKCVAYKSMAAGALFSVQYFTNEPFLMAAGGDAGVLALWESESQEEIAQHFKGRVQMSGPVAGAEVQVGTGEDEDEDEEDMETDEVVQKPKTKAKAKKGAKK